MTDQAERWLSAPSSSKYFELNNLKKAEKIYKAINRYYRNKDAKLNFLEEDDSTLEFRNFRDEIDELHVVNFLRFSEVLLK